MIEESLTSLRIQLKANENTWSHQRAKRRKRTADVSDLCKETVPENGQDSSQKQDLIVFNMQVKRTNERSILLEFSVDENEMKESLNQIVLYIRNKSEKEHFKKNDLCQ